MQTIDPRYRPNYDPASVQYMRDELTEVGFKELLTLDQVDDALLRNPDKTVFLMVNSVCGCAAGSARPGIASALQHQVIPDFLVSVFAGMDKQPVEYFRQRFLSDFVPSSPCFVLFKNGDILFIMERKDIVDKSPEALSEILSEVFDKYCSSKGPSIAREIYDNLEYTIQCSSNLPRYEQKSVGK